MYINDYKLVDYSIKLNEDDKGMREINDELKIAVPEGDL